MVFKQISKYVLIVGLTTGVALLGSAPAYAQGRRGGGGGARVAPRAAAGPRGVVRPGVGTFRPAIGPRFGFGFGFGYPYYPYWGYWGYPYYGYPFYGYPYGGYGYPYVGTAYGGVRLEIKNRQAQVLVDGYYAGIVDDFDGPTQHLNLTPGPHHIEVRAEGFAPLAFDVNVEPGQTIKYRADLKAAQP